MFHLFSSKSSFLCLKWYSGLEPSLLLDHRGYLVLSSFLAVLEFDEILGFEFGCKHVPTFPALRFG